MREYAPMLAVSGKPFDSEDYLYELKWDGIRALAVVEPDLTALFSRNGNNISRRYPELEFSGRLNTLPAVLDGEVVALQDGMPSFHKLQTRDHLQDEKKIRAAVRNMPAVFIVFDLLNLGGEDLTHLPLVKRKELLQALIQEGSNLALSRHVLGSGKALFELARQRGLEGVMAKRLDSPYQAGKRSGHWIKFRNTKSMSCIICGYVKGSGKRGTLGSLILGAYRGNKLVYIGNVGSGLGSKEIEMLLARFDRITRDTSPFEVIPLLKEAAWVEPELVCEVSYLEREQVLRHPVFNGLRSDVTPRECKIEQE